MDNSKESGMDTGRCPRGEPGGRVGDALELQREEGDCSRQKESMLSPAPGSPL